MRTDGIEKLIYYPLPKFAKDDLERIWSCVQKSKTGCWKSVVSELSIGGQIFALRPIIYELVTKRHPEEKITRRNTCDRTCVRPDHMAASAAERFWQRIHKTKKCWILNGPVDTLFYYEPRTAKSVAFELTYGRRPSAHLYIGDDCDKACVRPDHMLIVKRNGRTPARVMRTSSQNKK